MKFLVFALMLMLPWGSAAAEQTPSPYESVKTTTEALLVKLVEIQPLYESDQERFFQEVRGSLEPVMDFKGFARGVMAKYYRRADPEQIDQFAIVFKEALIRTYATALVEFDNQKVDVKQDSVQQDGDRASIRLEVFGQDGTVYPVDYTLIYEDGTWKLRNIVVNGINLGLQFRSQFSAYMQKYRNDIDAVIANWNVTVTAEQ